jgi:hypothetical protein
MAFHARRVIRETVVDVLKDARTAAGSNVAQHPFNDRVVAKSLVVEDFGAKHSESGQTETQEVLDFDGGIERHYRFCVIAEINGGTDPEGERDDLIGEVEAAIAAAVLASAFPGVKTIEPIAYKADDDNTGAQPIRRGLQVFVAFYITAPGDPTTPL